jgi:hypothetical protein
MRRKQEENTTRLMRISDFPSFMTRDDVPSQKGNKKKSVIVPNRAEQAVLIVIVHIIAFLAANVQTIMTQVRLILMAPLVVAAVAVSQNNQQLALAEQISSPSSCRGAVAVFARHSK